MSPYDELRDLAKTVNCPCGYSCLKKGYCCSAVSERVIDGRIVAIQAGKQSHEVNCGYYIDFGGGCYCSCPLHVEMVRRGLMKSLPASKAVKEGGSQTDNDEDATP
ncbi:hypothetical protein [Desulfuromonas acetoxidans]|uniref:Uncharacterized protein n=1 Tax=Desulfuromonas acetoxidans (strain DSM 684 / 11070) TaxID=281689 RepID=Q1JVT6_DESA6|nr:hypothetical protein [Desulfuromonas acetoxidans]EAT14350.1 hypothetical protein Dace_0190 [Desulfuromonas acetoxidans DSM 684]MBF0644565.1 hypothetical protein [Desulfuromonas acetoxidans]NVD23908.1 hypothetical protein [Desulfuromonas acetoxidans]NVE16205.1 hypothetical protein [Desulfuromonas acetoxidans]